MITDGERTVAFRFAPVKSSALVRVLVESIVGVYKVSPRRRTNDVRTVRTSPVESRAFFLDQKTLSTGPSTKQASPSVRETQTDHGTTSTKRSPPMRLELALFSEGLRLYSLHLSASSRASNLDARKKAQRRRLNGRRSAKGIVRAARRKVSHDASVVRGQTNCLA